MLRSVAKARSWDGKRTRDKTASVPCWAFWCASNRNLCRFCSSGLSFSNPILCSTDFIRGILDTVRAGNGLSLALLEFTCIKPPRQHS